MNHTSSFANRLVIVLLPLMIGIFWLVALKGISDVVSAAMTAVGR